MIAPLKRSPRPLSRNQGGPTSKGRKEREREEGRGRKGERKGKGKKGRGKGGKGRDVIPNVESWIRQWNCTEWSRKKCKFNAPLFCKICSRIMLFSPKCPEINC